MKNERASLSVLDESKHVTYIMFVIKTVPLAISRLLHTNKRTNASAAVIPRRRRQLLHLLWAATTRHKRVV
jgi:hypothetical protein